MVPPTLKIFPASIFAALSLYLPLPLSAAQEPQRDLCEEATQLLTEMRENGEEIAPGFSRFVSECDTMN